MKNKGSIRQKSSIFVFFLAVASVAGSLSHLALASSRNGDLSESNLTKTRASLVNPAVSEQRRSATKAKADKAKADAARKDANNAKLKAQLEKRRAAKTK